MSSTTHIVSTAPTNVSAAAATRPRAARIAILVARLALAATFINAAVSKLTFNQQAVAGFSQLGGVPMLIAVGVIEIAGAVGLVVPVLSGFAAIGTTALLTIFTIVLGATSGPATAVLPFGCLVLSAAIAFWQRHQTVRLAGLLRQLGHR